MARVWYEAFFFLAQPVPPSLWRPCRFAVTKPLPFWMRLARPRILDRFSGIPVKVSRFHDPRRLPSKRAFSRPRTEIRRRAREAVLRSPLERAGSAPWFCRHDRVSPSSFRSRRAGRLLGGASDIDLGIRARPYRFWRCLRFLDARPCSSTSATLRTTHEHDSDRTLISSPAQWFDPPSVYKRFA